MSINLNITTKIIVAIQLLLSLVFCYFFYLNFSSKILLPIEYELFTWGEISVISFIKEFQFSFFNIILGFFAAITLCYNQKNGWIGSIIFWSLLLTSFIVSIIYQNISNDDEFLAEDYLIATLLTTVSIAIILILTGKLFREKYGFDTKTKIKIISGIVLLTLSYAYTVTLI